MGRKTYETVLTFEEWPYQLPVFVLSQSLVKIEKQLNPNVEILSGSPQKIVKELNQRGYKNLYIDGGKTIQAFIRDDLIDEMIMTIIPKLLGEGVSLFERGMYSKDYITYKTELLPIHAAKLYLKRLNPQHP